MCVIIFYVLKQNIKIFTHGMKWNLGLVVSFFLIKFVP